jgi:hypothetical protein
VRRGPTVARSSRFPVSDLLPPPAPPGAGPPQPTRTTDPWRKYLVPGLVGGVLVLIVIDVIAGLVENNESSDADTSAACTTVDMEPLTGWGDPVTVVQLVRMGDRRCCLGGGQGTTPNGSAVILPVNRSARAYDPELGADVDVFGTEYADAASEAEAALAGCAQPGPKFTPALSQTADSPCGARRRDGLLGLAVAA